MESMIPCILRRSPHHHRSSMPNRLCMFAARKHYFWLISPYNHVFLAWTWCLIVELETWWTQNASIFCKCPRYYFLKKVKETFEENGMWSPVYPCVLFEPPSPDFVPVCLLNNLQERLSTTFWSGDLGLLRAFVRSGTDVGWADLRHNQPSSYSQRCTQGFQH